MASTANKLPRESTQLNIYSTLSDIKSALQTHNTNFQAWAGNLSSLTTGDKTSLVAAINAVQAAVNTHTTNINALHDIFSILDENVNTAAMYGVGGAALHNSIFRGKNLGTSITAEQSANIANGSFKGIWLGDYWQKTIDYEGTNFNSSNQEEETTLHATSLIMKVVHIDYCWRTGDSAGGNGQHHVTVVPHSVIARMRMNTTDTTEGGYLNSLGRQKYVLGTGMNCFKAFFGESHLFKYQDYLSNAVTNGVVSGWQSTECCVELMSAIQMYGYSTGPGEGDYPNTICSRQFALPMLTYFGFNPRLSLQFRNVRSAQTFAWCEGERGRSSTMNASKGLDLMPWGNVI